MQCCYQVIFFIFFQAEDGIRDGTVTGVQTCALPICNDCDKYRYLNESSLIFHFIKYSSHPLYATPQTYFKPSFPYFSDKIHTFSYSYCVYHNTISIYAGLQYLNFVYDYKLNLVVMNKNQKFLFHFLSFVVRVPRIERGTSPLPAP